jgi:hypothetical protein
MLHSIDFREENKRQNDLFSLLGVLVPSLNSQVLPGYSVDETDSQEADG